MVYFIIYKRDSESDDDHAYSNDVCGTGTFSGRCSSHKSR